MQVGIERVVLNATVDECWNMSLAIAAFQKKGLPGVALEVVRPQPDGLPDGQQQVAIGGPAFAEGHQNAFWTEVELQTFVPQPDAI